MKKRVRFNSILEAEEIKEQEEAKVLEAEGKDLDKKQDETDAKAEPTLEGNAVVDPKLDKTTETKDFDMKQVETNPHSVKPTEQPKEGKKVKEDVEIDVQPDGHVEVEVKQEDSADSVEPECSEPVAEAGANANLSIDIPDQAVNTLASAAAPLLLASEEEESQPKGNEEVTEECPECGAPDGECNCEHQPLTREVLENCKITEDLDLSEATSTSKTITVNLNGNTYAYEAESVDAAKDIVERFNKLRTFSKGRAINWLKGQVDLIGKVPDTSKTTEDTTMPMDPNTGVEEPVEEAVDASLYNLYETMQEKGINIKSSNGIVTLDNPDSKSLLALAQSIIEGKCSVEDVQVKVVAPQVVDSVKEAEGDEENPEAVPEVPSEGDVPPAEGDIPTEGEAPTEPSEVEVALQGILAADEGAVETIQSVIDKIKLKDEKVSLYRLESEEQEPKCILAKVDNGKTFIAAVSEEGELIFNDIPTQFADIENVTPDIVEKFLSEE